MNILVDEPPESVTVGGVEYRIATDFRVCLLVQLAFEDPRLAMVEKQGVALSLMFPGGAPPDPEAAMDAVAWFLNCGEEPREYAGSRTYSLSKDQGLIFAAFMQTHEINLQVAELHWWVFIALFRDLGAETAFCHLVGLRDRLASGKSSPEDREEARRLGDAVVVPDIDLRTVEEREAEERFNKLLRGGKSAKV